MSRILSPKPHVSLPAHLERLKSGKNVSLEELHDIWGDVAGNESRSPVEIYDLLGTGFLRIGQPIIAFNVADAGLEYWPDSLRLLKLKALALARSGAATTAKNILEGIQKSGKASYDALGILARTYKDLWARVEPSVKARQYLARAQDIYSGTYRSALKHSQYDAAIYNGINAAATALLLKKKELARKIATAVRGICLKNTRENDYWAAATLGEASLILGDFREAEKWYCKASAIGEGHYGDLSTTRRQARLLLQSMGRDASLFDPCFGIPKVIAFAGHMADMSTRPKPRFPQELEERIRRRIADRLRKYSHKIGFSGAARGSDMIFIQEMLKQKSEVNVVLPFRAEDFMRTSVDVPPRGKWEWQFKRALARVNSVVVASAHRVSGSSIGYLYANKLMNGLTLLRAKALHTEVVPMVVWNGQRGDGQGGTASHVEYWRARGIEPEIIDLSAEWNSLPLSLRKSITRRAGRTSGKVIREPHMKKDDRRIMALLIADVKNSSKVEEEQVPVFVDRFLGAVGDLISRSRNKPVVKNTWGDGLYLVFKTVEQAGLFALELRDQIARTKWEKRNLPAGLSLRIALHAGPLYRRVDPVTGYWNFFGTHATRVARIEPVTPAGHVYASQEFAALAEADGVTSFICHYIGELSLPKKAGTYPLYHVHLAP